MVNHMQAQFSEERKLFYRGEGELGGALINKDFIGGNWEFEI